jgi:tetratricopeptide (TPR) repeat protein
MLVILALVLAAFFAQQPETLSLLGEPLYPPSLSKSDRAQADEALRAAHAAYDKDPNAVANVVALARAHFAFGRVGDAIEVLTHGLEVNDDDPQLLRERGRGYLLIRKFDIAQRDLRKAAEKIPDAACDLALSQYLAGAFPHAQASYAHCKDPGVFGYLSARRAGASAERPSVARPETGPEEIRMPGSPAPQKEKARPPLATDYLDAAEMLIAGKKDEATSRLKDIVQKHRKGEWMDPAYIAAEADYARLYKPPHKKKKK